jgi:hypothetical protein
MEFNRELVGGDISIFHFFSGSRPRRPVPIKPRLPVYGTSIVSAVRASLRPPASWNGIGESRIANAIVNIDDESTGIRGHCPYRGTNVRVPGNPRRSWHG